MDWIFLIKTVFSFVLILCGTWYLRRDEKERYAFDTFLLVGILVVSALMAGSFAVSQSGPKNERVRITALNDRNPASKENTIYLTGVYANGKKIAIKKTKGGAWYLKDSWYVWRAPKDDKNPGELSQSIELELPTGKNRSIHFLANDHKGLVKIEYADTVQVLDCYSPEKKTLRVSLKNTLSNILTREAWLKLAVSLLLATLLSLFLIAMADRVRRGKQCLPLADTASLPVTYERDDALALKGIAIQLLLLYHLFLPGLYDNYSISIFPFLSLPFAQVIRYCKICVPLFAFMSGYGLFLSYRKNTFSDTKWFILRYIKTFSGFWLIVVLSWIVCQMINGRTAATYFGKNVGTGVVSMILDFAGLANLFGINSICGTWWYMSAALVFILLTPLVARREGKNLFLYCVAACVLVRVVAGGNMNNFYGGDWIGRTPYSFLLAFLMGALFAKHNILVRVANARYRWIRFVVEIFLLVMSFKLYIGLPSQTFFDINWGLLPLPFIMLCVDFIVPCRGIHPVLVFLGRHSMNIFLTHTFIRGFYFNDFIYSFKHFIIVYLVLLFSSLMLSLLLEQFKKTLRYDVFIDGLCDRITGYKF